MPSADRGDIRTWMPRGADIGTASPPGGYQLATHPVSGASSTPPASRASMPAQPAQDVGRIVDSTANRTRKIRSSTGGVLPARGERLVLLPPPAAVVLPQRLLPAAGLDAVQQPGSRVRRRPVGEAGRP